MDIPAPEDNTDPSVKKLEKDVIKPKISTMKSFTEFLNYATGNSKLYKYLSKLSERG
jgi:hypothetical protein